MTYIEEITGLTYLECKHWLKTGELPCNFKERIRSAVLMFDEWLITCKNCNGRQDMNEVFRDWFAECPQWCPNCVDESEVNKAG